MTTRSLRHTTPFLSLALSITLATCLYADHGPGTSGGGAATQSGETIKPGKVALEVREDYTEFEHLSAAQIQSKAVQAGNIDLVDRSFLSSVSIAYGLAENFQAAVTIGYYQAVRAREAEFDPGTGNTDVNTFNPDGLTDLWLTGKYRF